MLRRSLTLFVLIAAGALLTLSLEPLQLLSPDSASATRDRTLPKTYLENVRSLSFDEQGHLNEIREAKRLEHFERRDESLMESPRYYSHNSDDRTWSAVADRGRYQPSLRLLTLSDNVILTNDASGGHLETREMIIDLRQKTARSDVPVKITQGPNSTIAGGMFADLERERMEMQPDVESVYVQPQ